MDHEASKMWTELVSEELSAQHIIEFDESTHTYRVDGVIKPSVTQLIAKAIGTDYSWVNEYDCDRGTRNHAWSTLLMQGWANWWDIDDDCLPYVKNFAKIVDELELEYVSAEVPHYDPEYDICGTPDIQAIWKGKETTIELKTSSFEMHHALQLASYQRMTGTEQVMGIELKTGKIYVPADDWERNHDTLRDIHAGNFVLADWKVDKKRRRMKVMK